jgi:hypothetical protein
MKRAFTILLAIGPLAVQARFERWFEPRTMRFDYYHAGDAVSEE